MMDENIFGHQLVEEQSTRPSLACLLSIVNKTSQQGNVEEGRKLWSTRIISWSKDCRNNTK